MYKVLVPVLVPGTEHEHNYNYEYLGTRSSSSQQLLRFSSFHSYNKDVAVATFILSITTMFKSVTLVAFLVGFASAFSPMKSLISSPSSTQLHESFGLGVGTDTYEMQDPRIAGEATYKQWVNKVDENNMLNRKVC